ncbi:MAG: hypothetical protein AAGF95_28820 [Chloroflexota bacterium]
MTESEWLTSEDPLALLAFAADQANTRKYRLFLCACCVRVLAGIPPHHRHLDDIYSVTWHRLERAMAIVEQFAEGFVSTDMLAQARQDAENSTHVPKWGSKDNKLSSEVAAVVTAAVEHPNAADVLEACWRATNARWTHTDQDEENRRTVEMQWQATVCRDVFGNPFCPIAFSPEWRTAATVSCAARMYESRDFSAMPVLADALQDAGCKTTVILDHCRNAGSHVRGCWVVDLVLGFEG